MDWYYILFAIVFTIFIIKTIISWVAGEVDVDFDLDGDIDFDISSMFSFKGILHFLMGFSSYLSVVAYFDTNKFSTLDYINSICIGILFMVGLWYLYKLMMKFNHINHDNPDFSGMDCTVLTNLGNGSYVVMINTPQGSFKKTMNHMTNDKKISVGSRLRIAKDITNNVYVIH